MEHKTSGSPNKRAGIIGAGAAGLVCAREARREGLVAVVYEASESVGGVWVYRQDVEDDLLGQRPTQQIHGSLYRSLRTNLPREVMAFRDSPFDSAGRGDQRQFPEHGRVLEYLRDFSRDFDLASMIRFRTRVERVSARENGIWRVMADDGTEETFDAVMVCNGHYSRPRVPELPGMASFPGLLIHSHNYREPEMFAGQRVVIFGSGASGVDLAREIGECAKKVYWCATGFNAEPLGDSSAPIERRAGLSGFETDGTVRLADGSALSAIEAVIFCTGYHYAFPFLEEGIVSVEDNWVHPLYLDLIPPAHPTIAFIGLQHAIIPFPLFEMQAKWFLRGISGKYAFPDRTEMEEAVKARARQLRADGRAQRHFHQLADGQFAYINELANQCGADPLPNWFEPMARKAQELKEHYPEVYRDIPVEV